MILKFHVCSFALKLVELFRNSLPYQFSLISLGSALHSEPYGFGGKNTGSSVHESQIHISYIYTPYKFK
ncbi:hypothetical protein TSAR_007803 [Trichomalopsis sarcophagae]|uniref:Uncharacterized protein n=1 Tax=Trichomalopsis sarcophagae TaxID=543379 RepID=A0A232EQE3_9HYME|nr:hypothetical protein TSAR_007803 [Trichomalopsis sarcophagae]